MVGEETYRAYNNELPPESIYSPHGQNWLDVSLLIREDSVPDSVKGFHAYYENGK